MALNMQHGRRVGPVYDGFTVRCEPSYFASVLCLHPVLSTNPMLATIIRVSNLSMLLCKGQTLARVCNMAHCAGPKCKATQAPHLVTICAHSTQMTCVRGSAPQSILVRGERQKSNFVEHKAPLID